MADAVSSRSNVGHRGDQPVPLAVAERAENGPGRVVGQPVQFRPLGAPGASQRGHPDPPVGLAPVHRDQAVAGQAVQQPAQVAGVQAEPGAQPPDIAAVRGDLPEQPGLAERAAAGQERVVQRPDPLRHRPVEPPDLADHPGLPLAARPRIPLAARTRIPLAARTRIPLAARPRIPLADRTHIHSLTLVREYVRCHARSASTTKRLSVTLGMPSLAFSGFAVTS